MALGQGSAYPETGCFFSLSGRDLVMQCFSLEITCPHGRGSTCFLCFGCTFSRLLLGVREKGPFESLLVVSFWDCSCQLCGLDSLGLCKLNHAFLGFYGFHPFLPPFPPSVLTSTSLTLGWINIIEAEREAGPRGLGRGANRVGGAWGRLSGLPQAQEASRGRWDWRRRVRTGGLFLLQSLTWSQGCDGKWTETWNWEQKCQKWICLDGMKGQRRDGGPPWGRDGVDLRGTQQPTETSFILPSPSGMHRETNE